MSIRTRDRNSSQQSIVGGTSLLIIFSVLCMTVFALLSLSTVQVGTRMTNAEIKSINDYYEADAKAEKILADLRAGRTPENTEVSVIDGISVYSVKMSDTQNLEVEVSVSGSDYTVLRWQMVSTTVWEADDGIDLWNGN